MQNLPTAPEISANVMNIESWSDSVANLVVDALIDAALLQKNDFDRAVSIVGEEIMIRLVLGDYPPTEPSTNSDNDSTNTSVK